MPTRHDNKVSHPPAVPSAPPASALVRRAQPMASARFAQLLEAEQFEPSAPDDLTPKPAAPAGDWLAPRDESVRDTSAASDASPVEQTACAQSVVAPSLNEHRERAAPEPERGDEHAHHLLQDLVGELTRWFAVFKHREDASWSVHFGIDERILEATQVSVSSRADQVSVVFESASADACQRLAASARGLEQALQRRCAVRATVSVTRV
jgi:hypothetical protein